MLVHTAQGILHEAGEREKKHLPIEDPSRSRCVPVHLLQSLDVHWLPFHDIHLPLSIQPYIFDVAGRCRNVFNAICR